MYAEFFGLNELPFNITPDPRFLYLNDCYQEALAALAYGIDARKGFISLIGEAGTGKTTLLRRLLDTLDPRTRTVLLLNPTVSFDEILEHILIEVGVPTDGGGKLVQLQRLNEFLLEHTTSGGNVVLLIDEAQDLHPGTLEELRLLSNLETAREKILQIVLAGQPELEGILRNPALRQLRQRVTLNVRVRALTPVEVRAYVRTRLEHAGAADVELFTPEALARVAALSRGIPRLVNVLCDAALLMGFVAGTRPLTPAIVEAAWNDYSFEVKVPEDPPPAVAVANPVLPAGPQAMAPVAAPAPVPDGAPPPPTDPVGDRDPSMAAPAADAVPAAVDGDPATMVAEMDPMAPAAAPADRLRERLARSAIAASSGEPAPPAEFPAAPPPPPTELEPTPASAGGATVAKAANLKPFAPPTGTTTPGRATFSIPAAAALIGALAIVIYTVSIQDQAIDPLSPMADASSVTEEAAAPETGTAVAATPPALVAATPPTAAGPRESVTAVAPAAAPAVAPQIEIVRADGTPISAAEATDMIDHFRAAYETRDVERLVGLFAPDAVENGRRGLDAIAASYRTTFGSLTDLRYTLPSLAVAAGSHAAVRAPFVISYRQPNGTRGEVKGDAEWELERRDGRVRIVGLSYRLEG